MYSSLTLCLLCSLLYQLIHSVSTILTNLSRKNKTRLSASDSEYPNNVFIDPENTSPRRHLVFDNRTLYPAAHVNLSQIPVTQQIPTPHFPLPTKSINQPRQRLAYQSRGRPFSAEPGRLGACHETFSIAQSSSVFEEDNCFPVSVELIFYQHLQNVET